MDIIMVSEYKVTWYRWKQFQRTGNGSQF